MKFDIRDIPAYFINLDKDVDKYTSTTSLLHYLEFKDINRFPGIKANRGCEKSHHQLLSDKSIPTPCLVLEDDILFTGNDNFVIDVPDDADALYIGVSQWARFLNFSGPFVCYEPCKEDMVRIFNMMTTHAILYISEEYRNMISRVAKYHSFENPSPFDIGVADIQKYFNVYALDFPIFKQSAYNNKSTSIRVTDVGMDPEKQHQYFKSKMYKINELLNIPDKAGNRSHYSPSTFTKHVKTQDPKTTSKQDTNLGSTTESVERKDEGRKGKDPS